MIVAERKVEAAIGVEIEIWQSWHVSCRRENGRTYKYYIYIVAVIVINGHLILLIIPIFIKYSLILE